MYRGGVVAAGVALLGLVVALADVVVVHIPTTAWLVGTLGPVVVGATDGAVRGHEAGVDIDERGLRPVPATDPPLVTWQQVAGLHAERRRQRTVVTVEVADGTALRLAAPYDGILLGRDAQFERKLFTLRHLWETQRRWQA